MFRKFSALTILLSLLLSSCGSPSKPTVVPVTSTTLPSTPVLVKPAFETGVYPNLFRDYLGKSDEEIQARINAAWDQLFYGDDATERVYYPAGSDMAYVLDTGNNDVRSEGMSYGMMIAAESGGAGWDEWYAPFFRFVHDNNDVVRAVVYVNEGNSRIELNDGLVQQWKNETKQSFWLRGGPDLFNVLGFVK